MFFEAFSSLGGSVILWSVENKALCSQRHSNMCTTALCSSSGMHLWVCQCAWLMLLCREAAKVTVHPPVAVQFQKIIIECICHSPGWVQKSSCFLSAIFLPCDLLVTWDLAWKKIPRLHIWKHSQEVSKWRFTNTASFGFLYKCVSSSLWVSKVQNRYRNWIKMWICYYLYWSVTCVENQWCTLLTWVVDLSKPWLWIQPG